MSTRNLSILLVTSHCPHAPSYGSQLRVLNIAKLLSRVGKVSLVIVPYFPIDQGSLVRTREEFDIERVVQLTPVNLRNPVERIRHELDPSFLNTGGFTVIERDREAMLRMIGEYDVVWVHTIRTANSFRIYQWPHTVLDIDDLQSRLCLSIAKVGSGIIRSLLDYRMSFIWRRRERKLKTRFDVISVTSEEDRRYLGGDRRVQVVPNGFTPPSEVPVRLPTVPPRIGFIGTFKYLPNQAGVKWFIQSVWPRVKREVPAVHLRLVGEDSDRYFSELDGDIEGLGWVYDPSSEIASWAAMIVPVQIGAGTRVKIAEAFSRKCPVVSTSLGAFGYEVHSGDDLLLADTAQDFASACVLLLKSTELGLTISENAWRKFLNSWTWDAIGRSVNRAVEEALVKSYFEKARGHVLAKE